MRGLESKHCWKRKYIEAYMRNRERYLHCVRGVIDFNIILLVLTRMRLKLSLLYKVVVVVVIIIRGRIFHLFCQKSSCFCGSF